MSVTTVILFPGQGAYLPGFLAAFARHSAVREVLGELDAVAAAYRLEPISPLLLDSGSPSAEELMGADPARWDLAIFAGSMAAFTIIQDEHDRSTTALLGHSMGEVAALTAGGALSLADGGRIICERAAAFRAFPPPAGGMTALNISADRAESLVAALDSPYLCLAGDNAPSQCVLAGDETSLRAVESVAAAAGWQATRLRSPRIHHNPLLERTRRQFVESVAPISVRPLDRLVYSPHHSRWYRSDDNLLELMSSHLTVPVRFQDAIRYLHAHGAGAFIESGARSALSSLVAATVPAVQTNAPFRTRTHPVQSNTGTEAGEPKPAPGTTAATVVGADDAVAPTPTVSGSTAPEFAASADDLRVQVIDTFAEALQYPTDVFTDDADLEADLGIDSIKHRDVMTRLVGQLGMSALPLDLKINQYSTIPAVVELIRSLASQGEIAA